MDPTVRAAVVQAGSRIFDLEGTLARVENLAADESTMRHVAIEGRCFVLSACQYMTPDDCPKDYPVESDCFPDGALFRGGSVIVDPFGAILAGPVYDSEDILVAELDARRIVQGKFDLDVAEHYSGGGSRG